MHETLFPEKFVFSLYMVLVRHTAVHRTHRGTLGLFVKAHTFGTFIGYDIIDLVADRLLYLIGIDRIPVG
jgi:hypothetical protein